MAMLSFGGIDVSKVRLDVMLLPEEKCASVSNDAAGWTKLVEQLRGFSIGAIGLEASGGYERGVMRALLAAGMPVRQVNPLKLRQFARASGVLAKNDPLDARMVASFVAIMPTRPVQRLAPAGERVGGRLGAEKIAAENASRLLEDTMLRLLRAAVSLGLPPTSTCSIGGWSRSSRLMMRSSTAIDCLAPCRALDRCWLAR
jgi:transposase